MKIKINRKILTLVLASVVLTGTSTKSGTTVTDSQDIVYENKDYIYDPEIFKKISLTEEEILNYDIKSFIADVLLHNYFLKESTISNVPIIGIYSDKKMDDASRIGYILKEDNKIIGSFTVTNSIDSKNYNIMQICELDSNAKTKKNTITCEYDETLYDNTKCHYSYISIDNNLVKQNIKVTYIDGTVENMSILSKYETKKDNILQYNDKKIKLDEGEYEELSNDIFNYYKNVNFLECINNYKAEYFDEKKYKLKK